MLSTDFITFLKDWVLPIGSLVLSIWFAASARRDAQQADKILKNINDAVDGWQRQIMSSTANILDSLPQVVEGRATMARIDAAKALTEGIQSAIHEIAKNPQPGASGHTQNENVKTLVSQLNDLLSKMVASKTSSS
jgi:hypothetical protein